MTRHFDVADLESVAGIVARGILPRMKLASESLATEGPPAPPRRDEDVEAESRANARLLAAAPEMLEALRSLVLADSEGHADAVSEDETHNAATCAFCDAVTAIAKAEGQVNRNTIPPAREGFTTP